MCVVYCINQGCINRINALSHKQNSYRCIIFALSISDYEICNSSDNDSVIDMFKPASDVIHYFLILLSIFACGQIKSNNFLIKKK